MQQKCFQKSYSQSFEYIGIWRLLGSSDGSGHIRNQYKKWLWSEYDNFFRRFLSKYFPYIIDDFLKFGSGVGEISAIINHQIWPALENHFSEIRISGMYTNSVPIWLHSFYSLIREKNLRTKMAIFGIRKTFCSYFVFQANFEAFHWDISSSLCRHSIFLYFLFMNIES